MAASAFETIARWRRLAARVVAALGTAAAVAATAHPMPESRLWVDTDPAGLRLTLQMPLNRLEFAFGQPLAEAPGTVLARHGDALAAYVLRHVGARSGDAGWQALRPTLRIAGTAGDAELEASLLLRAPVGADPRQATLLCDALTHEVRTHRIQVFLRNDWAAGRVAGETARPLGELDHARTQIDLALGPPQPGSAVTALFKAGAEHIAEGTDHLLFLLMLLVAAPLAAQGGRWSQARPLRDALRQIGAVVSAFTLGHSVTLALGSTGLVNVPAPPVELAVAATIGVAAVHAWRPLFGAAETWMALGFGLIHGLAFSASLTGAGLTTGQHALALLAFNLGIEAMQLLLVALVLPLLLWLATQRSAGYRGLRRGTAVFALAAAGVWIVERVGALA